jgi:hypothetical protein
MVSTGITFFLGGAFNILVVITMLSIKGSSEIHEIVEMKGLNAFSDYLSGFIVMVFTLSLGVIFYLVGNSINKSRQADASTVA